MGNSSVGTLAYGYNIGGEDVGWKIEGADEFGSYQFPMLEDNDTFLEWARDVLNRIGSEVVIVQYGTYEFPGFILATRIHKAYDFGAKAVNIDIDHHAAGELDRALEALKIVPKQVEPKWILASIYG